MISAAASGSAAAEITRAVSAGHILIVDDDASIRTMLATMARRAGFAADTAPDGEIALAKLREQHFDLIVLDLMMPRANGYDVIDALKGDPHRPGVMILTAAGGAQIRELDPTVVQAVLRKPFDMTMFLTILTAVSSAIVEGRACRPEDLAVAGGLEPPTT